MLRARNQLADRDQDTAYTYDGVGDLATLKYPNGVTNLWQNDTRNWLTNEVWKLTTSTLGSFFYQLGAAGSQLSPVSSIRKTRKNHLSQKVKLTNIKIL